MNPKYFVPFIFIFVLIFPLQAQDFPSSGSIIYQEDYSSNRGNWYEGLDESGTIRYGIVNSEYQIEILSVTAENTLAWVYNNFSNMGISTTLYTDFELSVDVRNEAAPGLGGCNGITLYDDASIGFTYWACRSGRIIVASPQSGVLIETTHNVDMTDGAMHNMGIRFADNQISVYLDGTFISSTSFNDFSPVQIQYAITRDNDANQVAIGYFDNLMIRWYAPATTTSAPTQLPSQQGDTITISRNDAQYITADNFESLTHVVDIYDHAFVLTGLEWTDDGRYLVSVGQDGEVNIWDALTGESTRFMTQSALLDISVGTSVIAVVKQELTQPFYVYSIPDGRLLWSASIGESINTVEVYRDDSIAVGGKRSVLALYQADGTERFKITPEGMSSGFINGLFFDLAFSPNGERLIASVTLEPSHLSLYDAHTGAKLSEITSYFLEGAMTEQIYNRTLAFSPDGQYVFASPILGGEHGDIFSVADDVLTHHVTLDGTIDGDRLSLPFKNAPIMGRGIAFTPTGEIIVGVFGSSPRIVALYSPDSPLNEKGQIETNHLYALNSADNVSFYAYNLFVALHPDGNLLAIANGDDAIVHLLATPVASTPSDYRAFAMGENIVPMQNPLEVIQLAGDNTPVTVTLVAGEVYTALLDYIPTYYDITFLGYRLGNPDGLLPYEMTVYSTEIAGYDIDFSGTIVSENVDGNIVPVIIPFGRYEEEDLRFIRIRFSVSEDGVYSFMYLAN